MSREFKEAGWSNSSDSIAPVQGKLAVMFHEIQRKNNFRSKKENRPVYEPIVHIIKIPADQHLRIDRPVTEADIEEYPLEWERWQKTRETKVIGMPIEMWHAVSDTQKAEFRALSIFTIEQFANLPDSYAQKIMGFNDLRAKAKSFIESGKDAELVARIREEANAEVSAMRKELDEMKALLKKKV